LTAAGSVVGTPAFMPPEQARGDALDERADVFALGAILYYVLSGQRPYEGRSSLEVLQNVMGARIVPLDEREASLPEELLAIVRKAVAPARDARYPTALQLAE